MSSQTTDNKSEEWGPKKWFKDLLGKKEKAPVEEVVEKLEDLMIEIWEIVDSMTIKTIPEPDIQVKSEAGDTYVLWAGFYLICFGDEEGIELMFTKAAGDMIHEAGGVPWKVRRIIFKYIERHHDVLGTCSKGSLTPWIKFEF